MAGDAGQPPVDHLRLTERPEHDVVRLDVAVENTAAVGILDRLTGIDEVPEELAEAEHPPGRRHLAGGGMMIADRPCERAAGDQPHHLEQPPPRILPDVVDRRDVGMLERRPGPDFLEKGGPVPRVVGVAIGELLQKHLAAELEIAGDEHLPHPPALLRPQHPIARSPGGVAGQRDRGARLVPLGAGRCRRAGRGGQAAAEYRGELRRDQPLGVEIGEALLHIPLMLLEMPGHDILDDLPRPWVDRLLRDEDLGDRARRLPDPLGDRGRQLVARDVVEVDREDRTQKASGWVGRHGCTSGKRSIDDRRGGIPPANATERLPPVRTARHPDRMASFYQSASAAGGAPTSPSTASPPGTATLASADRQALGDRSALTFPPARRHSGEVFAMVLKRLVC